MPSRNFQIRVPTTAVRLLQSNPDRSSYMILNQHAALAIYVCSGTSHGPHVTTSGAHEGDMIGPNGGQLYDNDDLDEVWAIATAVNNRIKVTEKTRTGRLMRTDKGELRR